MPYRLQPLLIAIFVYSLCLILYELLLTRIFAVVLFAQFAHLALALALLGISVGAVLQHLRPSLVPEVGLERRMGWLGVYLAGTSLLAIAAALHFPVLDTPEKLPEAYQDTSFIKDQLLNPGWFMALLPFLAGPFVVAGLAFAGAFQRLKDRIGPVYGADLAGGAMGAVLFLPLLQSLAGPDVVFVVMALALAGAALLWEGRARVATLVAALVCAGLAGAGLRAEVLKIKQSAGFSEVRLTYTEWTPLTRLAIHEDGKKVLVLLDNASASEVPMSLKAREKLTREANRSLVYRLHSPGPVAILAASAGPEVAAAQHLGFTDIDAIDIASEIFDIVADRFPNSPVNPYLQPGVNRVHADGRAAILRADQPYTIIQMVHANLWSAAGILANTWSPALLETRDAFTTYLDHLADDGTLSFGRGDQTDAIARSAAAALRAAGVQKPWQAMAYVTGTNTVLLIKKRPWTEEEQAKLREALAFYPTVSAQWDLSASDPPEAYKDLVKGLVMTDERPYVDTFSSVQGALRDVAAGKEDTPLAALYRSVLVQLLFAAIAGLFFLVLPWFYRGRSEVGRVSGTGSALLYTAGLGYGYLAVETVLVHDLVLFVGHPTYAITVVILAMLLSSGAGSMWVDRWPAERLLSRLRWLLPAVVGLGLLMSRFLPPALHTFALHWPLEIRLLLTFVVLLPLGLLMGMPFPLAVRILPASAAPIIPWCWAINGWMSVLASLGTVLIARLWGYEDAMAVGLGAYVLAAVVAGRLGRVGSP